MAFAEDRTYYLYRALFAVGRYLPRPVATALAHSSGLVSAATMAGRRQLITRHLDRATGGLAEPDRQRAVRQAFLSYAHYWLESARATGASAEELDTRTSYEGLDHIDAALAAGRGAILALPHLGTWDSGGAFLASIGYPLTVVVEPIRPQRLFDWFAAMRASLGLEVVPLGPTAVAAVTRRLRQGGLVALVSDRDLAGTGVEVEFFGERTRLPGGAATLALRTGAALLPVAVYLQPKGRMHAVVRPALPVARQATLREDVVRVTQALAAAMEELIRAHPEQWHLFQPNWPSDPGYRG
ncbi:MAG TPA: phosphatidylinositol mannoside acyltransferase [Acidimicrobiales bacterium]|nr:phosphatidylinositol mannoside acyltransferase [Acidimicrobiales bacterium]